MRASALTLRERRVIAGGAMIITAALSYTYLLHPYAQRWQARREAYTEAVASTQRLTALTADQTRLERAADAAERALADLPRRILRARSATLGASALQSLVQGAADASHVVLTRIIVTPDSLDGASGPVGEADSARALHRPPSLPVQLAAYGDITGITRFLTVLATGPQVIVTDRVTVQRNSALAGAPDVVQLTLTAHAPLWRADGATNAPPPAAPATWRAALAPIATEALAPPVAAVDRAGQQVINGNVFSATRRAPRVAFVEPGQTTVTPTVASATDSAAATSTDYPVLSGIITVQGERQALLQWRADDGVPRLYRVGSGQAGYRVLAIQRDTVILSGPTGRRTLGLSTRSAPVSREPLP